MATNKQVNTRRVNLDPQNFDNQVSPGSSGAIVFRTRVTPAVLGMTPHPDTEGTMNPATINGVDFILECGRTQRGGEDINNL